MKWGAAFGYSLAAAGEMGIALWQTDRQAVHLVLCGRCHNLRPGALLSLLLQAPDRQKKHKLQFKPQSDCLPITTTPPPRNGISEPPVMRAPAYPRVVRQVGAGGESLSLHRRPERSSSQSGQKQPSEPVHWTGGLKGAPLFIWASTSLNGGMTRELCESHTSEGILSTVLPNKYLKNLNWNPKLQSSFQFKL